MSTFLDINVLLELLLPGRTKPEAAERVIANTLDLIISPLSAHLYVHFGKKGGIALDRLLQDVERYNYTAFGTREIAWAIANRQDDDFEDAMQLACAVLYGCKTFVTFDSNLAKNYGRFIKMKLL